MPFARCTSGLGFCILDRIGGVANPMYNLHRSCSDLPCAQEGCCHKCIEGVTPGFLHFPSQTTCTRKIATYDLDPLTPEQKKYRFSSDHGRQIHGISLL